MVTLATDLIYCLSVCLSILGSVLKICLSAYPIFVCFSPYYCCFTGCDKQLGAADIVVNITYSCVQYEMSRSYWSIVFNITNRTGTANHVFMQLQ